MLTETTKKMASIQRISKFSPIEGYDFLELAEMENLGWKVVVENGKFSVGDRVVYFEIDSAINVCDSVKPLEFLKELCVKKLFTFLL